MRKNTYLYAAVGMALFMSSCGIHFVSQQLDLPRSYVEYNDAEDEGYAKEAFTYFTNRDVYSDDVTDAWGLEKDACKDFAVNEDDVYSGNKSIELKWDRSKCDWVGMGFGWSGWTGKDMGDIKNVSAFEFYAKAATGETPVTNLVFLLEDYSNSQSGIGMNASYAERPLFDSEWQRVVVPVGAFPFVDTETDPYNIKQLLIQFEGTGHILIDEIKVIYHEYTAPVKNNVDEEPHDSPFPKFKQVNIYSNNTGHVWGIEKDDCKNIRVENMTASADEKMLHLEWSDACKWAGMGFGWSNWEAKDISSIADNAAIRLRLRAADGQVLYNVPFVALIEDYNGVQSGAIFSSRYINDMPIEDDWHEAILPLSRFHFDKDGLDLTNVKQLIFQFLGAGELYIDDIELVEYKPDDFPSVNPVFAKPVKYPVYVFNGEFMTRSVWGLTKDTCRDFRIESKRDRNHLKLTWNENDACEQLAFGTTWNKWEQTDITEDAASLILEMEIQGETTGIKVGLENYSYQKAMLPLDKKYITEQGGSTNFYRIPVEDILSMDKNMNRKDIKQLLWTFEGSGEVTIKEINLVKN